MSIESNRHAMNYGIVLGVIFSLNFFVSTIPAISFLQFLIMAAIIVVVCKLTINCRNKVYNGTASYGKLLWYIIQLFMYASLISAFFKYLFYTVLKPNFLNEQIETTMQTLSTIKSMQPHIDSMQEIMSQSITPLNMAIQSIWLNILAGVILGLIIAAFLYKSPTPFDNNKNNK